ncbi:fluoride efflux transporter CrcB [Actinomycetospora soli]|uniref:fluoride efflux transporter CrcB n=1 Tax=Actinomycetospora soli TaxID=2893887 RepID=UPI001E5E04AE|nr:fluoride efflux transporter CrcB [Actinomycetospora soli]MCD2191063.1 fluoride efflux transporter CrcB [Actinomycetospora soli]
MTPEAHPTPTDTDPATTGPGVGGTPRATDDTHSEDVIAGRRPGEAMLRGQGAITVAVSIGGALGALARWVLQVLFPPAPGGFPAATFAINVVGCLLMGVLVVLVTEARESHPLLRPFLGVGVLGGFTTFSSFTVEAHQLLAGRHLAVAGLYLALTIAAALVAVVTGLGLTRRAAGLHRTAAAA